MMINWYLPWIERIFEFTFLRSNLTDRFPRSVSVMYQQVITLSSRFSLTKSLTGSKKPSIDTQRLFQGWPFPVWPLSRSPDLRVDPSCSSKCRTHEFRPTNPWSHQDRPPISILSHSRYYCRWASHWWCRNYCRHRWGLQLSSFHRSCRSRRWSMGSGWKLRRWTPREEIWQLPVCQFSWIDDEIWWRRSHVRFECVDGNSRSIHGDKETQSVEKLLKLFDLFGFAGLSIDHQVRSKSKYTRRLGWNKEEMSKKTSIVIFCTIIFTSPTRSNPKSTGHMQSCSDGLLGIFRDSECRCLCTRILESTVAETRNWKKKMDGLLRGRSSNLRFLFIKAFHNGNSTTDEFLLVTISHPSNLLTLTHFGSLQKDMIHKEIPLDTYSIIWGETLLPFVLSIEKQQKDTNKEKIFSFLFSIIVWPFSFLLKITQSLNNQETFLSLSLLLVFHPLKQCARDVREVIGHCLQAHVRINENGSFGWG